LSHAIGSGGFGEVWLARNRHTGQLYAVKVFPAEQAIELDGVREYKKRSQGHPNLVPIEHVGRTLDGRHVYYVMPPADEAKGTALVWEMEDYEPVTLQRLLRYGQAPLPLDQVLAIADQLLAALAHLHQAGLIHKDVKPANVLRIKGVWQLGDMGLLAHSDRKSIDAGTPGFRPPEGPVDRTADLYALGKTIFLLATGADLSQFEDLAADQLALPGADTRSEPLRALLRKACAENPNQRYRTAAEMQQALAELRRPQPAGRGWARWGVGAAAVLLLAAAVSYYLFVKPPVEEPPQGLLVVKDQRGNTRGELQLKGYLDVFVWESKDQKKFVAAAERQRIRLPLAVPLRATDFLRIQAHLDRPAYLYVIWVDTESKATPIYPWQEDDWTKRPNQEQPLAHLALPGDNELAPLGPGPPGIETLLLLAREKPLTDAENTALPGLFTSLPRTTGADVRAAAWFENGELVNAEREPDRGPIRIGLAEANPDPVLGMQALLQRRLRPFFSYTRGVCFGTRGR
jgi:hypothetical protein